MREARFARLDVVARSGLCHHHREPVIELAKQVGHVEDFAARGVVHRCVVGFLCRTVGGTGGKSQGQKNK